MIGALRQGRTIDIVLKNDPYMAEFPITCQIIGEEARVLPAAVQIVNGELVPWRSDRLVQVYTDPGGWRTLRLADIVMR